MKAAIITKYGSAQVIQIQEVDKPSPKNDEILVKVFASSVTKAETMMREGKPYIGRLFLGLCKPKNPISGVGFSGKVESFGKNVEGFSIGDDVFGESIINFGANAEYICLNKKEIILRKSPSLTHEQACNVCDGVLTSYSMLKDITKLKAGQKILINGASGSLGSTGVQIAKYLKADVTAVCSTKNIELVKSLGADKVIDYTNDDFIKTDEKYDVIYDSVGTLNFCDCKNNLSENGVFISPVFNLQLLLQMSFTSKFSKKKAIFSATGLRDANILLEFLNELKEPLNSKKIAPIVEKVYTLKEIVKAHQHADSERKRGSIALVYDAKYE